MILDSLCKSRKQFSVWLKCFLTVCCEVSFCAVSGVTKEKVRIKADCFSTMALQFLHCVLKGKSLDHRGSVKHYVPVPRQFPIEYVPELWSRCLKQLAWWVDSRDKEHGLDSEKGCQVQNVLKGNSCAQRIVLCFTHKFPRGS